MRGLKRVRVADAPPEHPPENSLMGSLCMSLIAIILDSRIHRHNKSHSSVFQDWGTSHPEFYGL